jgi:membrane associated rhomboid family serine protease
MNGPRPPLPVRVAEGWVAFYTRGLPGEVRDARRAELRSDLFEHRQHASADGRGRLRWSVQVGGRVVRGMADDLWWRFAQQAAGRPATAAAERRRQLLAWLFDWVVSPAFAIGVLLSNWFSTSPLRLGGALVAVFVVLAVLRMRLVGPISNESALMFVGVTGMGADPGRLRRLWGGLLASVLLLVGVRVSTALLDPLRGPAEGVVNVAWSLAWMGIFVSVLMLLNEYARRWRRQRRRRSGK